MKAKRITRPAGVRVSVLPSTQKANDKNVVKVTFKRITTQYLRTGSNPEPGVVQWRKGSVETRLLDKREIRDKGIYYAMQREDTRVMLRYRCQLKKGAVGKRRSADDE